VLLQGFYRETWSEGVVHISTGADNVSSRFGDARAASTIRGWCNPGGVVVRRAPEPGPARGDRVELYDLFLTRPRRPSAGRRVRFPQPPSVESRITDSSLAVSGWFEWTPMPRSIRVGLRGFARWGSVPFARDRGHGSSPSVGSPRLAALAGSRTRHVGHPRAGGLEEQLECACPCRP
jgi:hypothetical protein